MNSRWRLLCQTAFATLAVASVSVVAAQAGSDEEFAKNVKNPDLWPGMGRTLGLQRHSDLKDINKENVGRLQLAWAQSTGRCTATRASRSSSRSTASR
ncbi:hypothetical protein [Methylocella sp.]|uniref:hypothetical protein n=1 Tax=Methylocella sp. TaxID=1978226 RepID=UPI0035AEDE1D